MAASAASVAKWKALQKQGAKWGTVAKDNAAALAQYEQHVKANPKLFGFKGDASKAALYWNKDNPLYKKALHKFNQQLPHKAPHGLNKALAPIGKLIPVVAGGAIAGGLASAASNLLAETGLSDTVASVQGGFGPATGGASVIGGGGTQPMNLFGGGDGGSVLDDVFGGLSKAGQYAEGFGKSLAQFKGAFGSDGDGGGGGGYSGGPSGADMGPSAPAAPAAAAGFDWKKWAPWIIGGGAVALLLILFLFRRRR